MASKEWVAIVDEALAASPQAPDVVAVGTGATSILAAATTRRHAVFRNTSLVNVYLGYTNAITTANAPIILGPGEMWIEDKYRGELFGIVATGSANVAVQEVRT